MPIAPMVLGFSLTPFGHHPEAWRNAPAREALSFSSLLAQVIHAEDSGFDFVLLADRLAARPTDTLSALAVPFEPTTLVSALSTRARRIGFLAVASTGQHEPYNLARRFASLDTISSGRTGWVVAGGSSDEARDREYLDAIRGLWDSWEDDAFVYDKAGGRFFSPEKMHVLNHQGHHFSVRGPLNVNRSPQGRPVLGCVLSDQSTSLAARHADIVFLQSETLEQAKELAADFERRIVEQGRQRSDVRVVANILPFMDKTAEKVQAVYSTWKGDDAEYGRFSGSAIAGTAVEIADRLEQSFRSGPLDGFMIMPPTLADLTAFNEQVAPELTQRGLLAANGTVSTLRDRLHLPHPEHPAKNAGATS